ncbi:MAG TPA: NmrA family NAD(P)-binding protein [Pseudonocardiaceae bacterium]|nr:NmrA family NAD(P)-binding protein [Pseudonocardiaceae bacterium]
MILVIGAGGRNGRAVLAELVTRGYGEQIVAATRKPESLADTGVRTVVFDWQCPETYASCVDGAQLMYLIAPERMPGMPERAHELLEHAVAAGVRQVVFLSAMGVQDRADLPLRKVERSVMNLCGDWTLLRPNWFMQNFSSGLFRAGIADRDEIVAPAGHAGVSFVDVRDIAASAATVLADPAASNHRTYTLTGSAALTFREVAEMLTAATGRPIRYQELDPQDPALLAKMGIPGRRPEPVRALFDRVRAGLEAKLTDDVAMLTGRPPITFPAFAVAHVDSWLPPGQ